MLINKEYFDLSKNLNKQMQQVKVIHLCKYQQVGKTKDKPKLKVVKTTKHNSTNIQDVESKYHKESVVIKSGTNNQIDKSYMNKILNQGKKGHSFSRGGGVKYTYRQQDEPIET